MCAQVYSDFTNSEQWDRLSRQIARGLPFVGLQLTLDGFAPSSRRKHSCWPIVASVTNLSPSLRVKSCETLLLGLVPGPSKRDVTPFLKVLLLRELQLLCEGKPREEDEVSSARPFISNMCSFMRRPPWRRH